MKNLFILSAASALMFAAACSENATKSGDAGKAAEAGNQSVTYTVDAASSKIEWEGKKLAYKHWGTLALSNGSLAVEGEKISAGSFTIDMASLAVLDVEDPTDKAKLTGHLLSPDFFAADSFPAATFEIVQVNEAPENPDFTHTIEGNLTLRGITRKIYFPANITINESNLTAEGSVVINRTEWNVMWGSENVVDWTKDKIVSNDIGVKINLVAKAQSPTAAK